MEISPVTKLQGIPSSNWGAMGTAIETTQIGWHYLS